MHHVSPLESWNLGKEHSQSPEMQQSLSNEFDSLIKRWEKVRDAFSTLEGQWVQKKPGLEALEKLHGSRMSLLMSTDAMTFERSNISKALDRLRKALRARTALPVTPGDTDLAAKFESMNLSLTGDNLPRDIVTRLIEAVPANEAWNATITPTPGLLRSQRQLRAAHSVLQALPTWIFHSSENDRDLIEHLIHIIQANLIDRVISCISDIMKVVAPRVYGGDYNMLIYQAIIVLTRSAAHLLEIQPSKQASIPWAETTPTLRQLVMEANTFSAHLASVLGLNGELKSNPYSGVADILALPPVHFLIYVPRKNEGFAEEDELMRDDSIEDVESAGDRIMEDDDLMGDEIVTQDDDITESNSGISQLRDVINADSFIAVSAGDLLYKDSRPE
ncbi:hypothetical protein F5Y10DRAFT_231558 [Nemania abortiva]|nr:hypothetical protein F5Y10DRAFT_231558 [Nemania abortiva]